MFKNLRVKFKLLLFVEFFALVFLGFGWYAFDTMNVVKVDGDIYHDIIRGKDVIADLSAPGLYILESYMLAVQLSETEDAETVQSLLEQSKRHRERYEARRRLWIRTLREGGLRKALEGPAHTMATKFFRIFDDEYLPALRAEDRGRIKDILHNELKNAFEGHRRQVEKILTLAQEEARESEEMATATMDSRQMILIVLGVGALLFAVFFVAFPISRAITKPLKEVEEAAKKIANGDLDCRVEYRSRDEFGSLAESFRKTISYIQEAAGVADSLSRGDLSIEIRPRSDKDVLGRSQEAMTQSLSRLIGSVKHSVVQLMSTATEIAATSKQQEMTVNDYGTSTNQMAAAVKEISATAQELAKTMDEVTQTASESSELADSGRSGLSNLELTMKELADAAGSISSKLYAISEKANDINMVVTTITKVADQTNLLSINAAIEAEKAGEYGVGFLVVAREIRRLADQTAVATLDIDQTVKQMQSAVSSGVMEMDKFTEQVREDVREVQRISTQLTGIIEGVQALIGRFESVNEGMRSQSLGAQQISQAMVQLTEGARQTATSLKDFNKSTEHMHEAVKGLKDELSRFRVNS